MPVIGKDSLVIVLVSCHTILINASFQFLSFFFIEIRSAPPSKATTIASTSTTTTTTTTTSTTTTTPPSLPTNPPTTGYPTTFFDSNPIRASYPGQNLPVKPPQIALLPVVNNNQQQQQQHSNNNNGHSNIYTNTNNPYNSRTPEQSLPPMTTPSIPISSHHHHTTSSPTSIASSPSSTTTTGTTTSTAINSRNKHIHHQQHHTSIHQRPNTQKPSMTHNRIADNEIPDGPLNPTKNFLGKPSKIAAARLNMGGIIALGIFGGFVFLAAVITIIVIIVRR